MNRLIIILLLSCLHVSLIAQLSYDRNLAQLADEDYSYLDGLYKHLHANPELSFYEEKTSSRMAQELRRIGFEVTENLGGYGVVGVLKNGEGPVIMVRTDTDALPILEKTGLPYASEVVTKDDAGKEVHTMHACGHDIHMTVWTGTARMLANLRDQWKGTLIFIAQPAEERGGGAKAMLEDGLFEKFPLPDYALALHVNATMAHGTVGLCPGYALANVDMVDIIVKGEGGHGAYPHTTKDPVVLAARIIVGLQTIVSREISPLVPAVVTVGSIHGGTKGNVIPGEVKLELTCRSYTDDVRNQIIETIRRVCKGEAISAGIPEEKWPVVTVRDEFTPALYNDLELTKRIHKVFADEIGEENAMEVSKVMGGEDFGRYGRTAPKVPIMLYWLGTIPPEKAEANKNGEIDLPSLHSDKFAPIPEPSIKTGVITMSAAVLDLLSH